MFDDFKTRSRPLLARKRQTAPVHAGLGSAGLAAHVTLYGVGLSDATERRNICFFPEHPNLTCDLPRHTFPWTALSAEFVEGDQYVRDRQIDRIDFAKIDVEGAEYRVLRGLRDTIAAGPITCIQFEYGAFSIQTRVPAPATKDRLSAIAERTC